jgi:DNA-binding CsgD family transcriptional regulator/PAS domain-containing protein
MIDDDALRRMKLAAYEAAGDSAGWDAFLETVRVGFGATSACLRSMKPETGDAELWVESGTDPATKPSYIGHWGAQDPWVAHPLGHGSSRAGRCFIASQIIPWPELERTAFYNDFARTAGIKSVMTAMVEDGCVASMGRQAKLAVFREPRLPDFDSHQLEAFKALQPALRKALHMHIATRQMRVPDNPVEETLDAIPTAIFVLRPDGRVDYANPAARALWGSGALSKEFARVAGTARVSGSRWVDALAAAAAGTPQEFGLCTAETGTVGTATVILSRLPPDSPLAVLWHKDGILAIVQRENADRARETRLNALAGRYGLTPSEVQVLKLLAEGQSVEVLARSQRVRVSTVRTHIRHLLEKTYTSRTVDLVRLAGG